MSLTVWITWNTHILQQKSYRILTSDLDSNSSRHVHLNEHQEDILPRKKPRSRHSAPEEAKSLHLETKYWIQRGLKSATSNPAKLLLIRSQHHHFVMNQIATPKKPPDQKESSMSLTVWITWNTHILQQKSYRILTSDLDSNSSRHVHLNEHQEDILPRKRPRRRHSAPEEAKSLHFGKIDWIQRGLESATSNPAKVLLISSQHHHFVMNQITTPKKPPDQKEASMSLTVWRTWNTHILQQKSYRILTSDLDSNSSRHVHLNEHQEDILPRKRPKTCILEK